MYFCKRSDAVSKKNKNKLDKNFADAQEIDFSSEVMADKLNEEDELFDREDAEKTIHTLQKELKKAEKIAARDDKPPQEPAEYIRVGGMKVKNPKYVPPIEDIQQQPVTTVPSLEQHLTDLQEYAKAEHGIVPHIDVTPENYPWLSFDQDGNPTLFEDVKLEEKLALPDHVKAIQQQNGVIHTAFMPEMLQPAFAGTMEVGHSILAK